MTVDPSAGGQPHAPKIDTSVPHSARIWNYWLGGKDNYAVDREAGDQYLSIFPGVVEVARASRQFLNRSVHYLAGAAGIRQFLDVGTGLPTVDNTHEIAQRVAPDSKIVYVDNDPLVLVHAHALLVSNPQGVTDYVDADLREPEKILAAAAATLDLARPVGLILSGILGHIPDLDQARSIVATLLDGLSSGSHLSINDGTKVIDAAEIDQAQQEYNDTGAVPYQLRTPAEIAGFFDGLELVEPGVVSCPLWRPDPDAGEPIPVDAFGGVGRKP
jgi:O-methyltransferase involved in polyketide biosynthesis